MKRTYIKSLKFFSLLTFMLVGQSCQDVLKENVISGISNDYISTPAGFNAAINSAYATLRGFYGTQQGLTVTEYGTDLYATGADGGYKGFHFYDAQLNSQVDWLKNIWDELYRGINTCNAVIERAPSATGITDALKKQRVAEMKFLRAHYYFLLLQQWGGVDLRLTETLAPTKKTTRASEADMYKAIIADLEASLPDLENKAKSSDYGRATKAASEHLLARVYLAKAMSSSKAADDYSKAATYASNVINNYGFKLLPDFASVFAQGAGEINSEVIFAVQYTVDPLTNTAPPPLDNTGDGNTFGNNLHLFFGMQYDVQAGMVRDVVYDRPFKRLRPTKYCIDNVFGERVNDSRYKKTFRDTWLSNSPGTYNTAFDNSKAKVTFKTGDTAIYIPGYEMSVAERAKRPYQVLVPSAYTEALFPTLVKFMDPLRQDKTYAPGSRDFLCFRLADTYLMLAEAQLMQGKVTEATEAVNVVRRRAAWPGKTAAMEITPAQLTFDFLVDERGRELCGEQIRWMDLKRWGNLVDRVQKTNPQAASNIKPMHLLRPIPQSQIDRTEGGAASFPQNPGY
ncbi:RagB/SusD family nutrient uptake outer membrane protein [Arcicella aquatica]|uniref:RagB/SusD family nutrient uptake outer membrane protein n=1 Tax=Arcicella aquatica TaxID=217141 RepID=A0ABU5QP20_9BACT|nr:RagB/SusD family nutrient uptake outer membrane protein [Arcicella aquatica]MEA5258821.1 RagB/SusD family nutrient uptake outer membrane protein [Arcicella aquatica]